MRTTSTAINFAPSTSSLPTQVNIVVDDTVEYQDIVGFGGALSKQVINIYSPQPQRDWSPFVSLADSSALTLKNLKASLVCPNLE